jgi:hypothetical protein
MELFYPLKMSKSGLISVLAFLIIAVLLTPSTSAQTSPSDDDMVFKWRYGLSSDITAITTVKLNNEPVVLIASGNTLYVLDKDGNLKDEHTLQTSAAICAINVVDVDNDNDDEILLGVGWMETEVINLNKVYPPPDGVPEEEYIVYRTLRNNGSLYVVDGRKVDKWEGVDKWVRSILISDVNGDDKDEIIVVAGGYTNDYIKKFTDIILMHRNCSIEWDLKYSDYETEEECVCSNCVWNETKGNCYLNVSERKCEWREIKDRGWNYSERSSINGSIIVFNKSGDLMSKSNISGINETFLNADVSNLYRDRDEEIIIGSGDRILIFNQTGYEKASYAVLGDVDKVYAADINNDEQDDMVFSFMSHETGINGIEAISKEGVDLWVYRMKPDSTISSVYVKSTDEHGINEVIFVSDGTLYVLDERGKLDWTYQFKYNKLIVRGIDRILSADLDGNGFEDLMAISNRMVYCYELIGTFIKKQSADKYYALGNENYELNKYRDAKNYLERARQLYLEANFTSGVSDCDSLLTEIDEKLRDERRAEADSQYAKALVYSTIGDYVSSKEYLDNARAIYLEIGDSDGALKCDSLLTTITATTTTTTTETTLIATTTLPEKFDVISLLYNPAVLFGLIVVILLIVAIFEVHKTTPGEVKGKKKGKQEKDGVLIEEWGALEDEWKGLEE